MERIVKVAVAIRAVGLAVLFFPAHAGAADIVLCVAFDGPHPGMTREALGAAIEVERMKSGINFTTVQAVSSDSCPSGEGKGGAMLVVTGARATLSFAKVGVETFDLAEVPPGDRPQDLARLVLTAVAREASRRMAVEADGPPDITPAGHGRVPAGLITLGGRYDYLPRPDVHRAGLEIAGGIALFDERLLAGLRAAWQLPSSVASGGGKAGVSASSVVAVASAGFRSRVLVVRGGLGAGLEWRRVALTMPAWAGSRTEFVPVFDAEVEVVVLLGGPLRLSAAGRLAAYASGRGYTYRERVVWDPPRYAAGAALRLGFLVERGR